MKTIKNPKTPFSILEQTNTILTTFGIFIRMKITLRDKFTEGLTAIIDHVNDFECHGKIFCMVPAGIR